MVVWRRAPCRQRGDRIIQTRFNRFTKESDYKRFLPKRKIASASLSKFGLAVLTKNSKPKRKSSLSELRVNFDGKKAQGYSIKTDRYRLIRWTYDDSGGNIITRMRLMEVVQ